MGKRSTTSTKSGKFMNPTDQARKEARRKELKKNKKQRMAVRHAVLKGKDALKIIQDLDEVDDMEFNTSKAPALADKVLKEKRKKLTETFERVLKLYEREDQELYEEFRELWDQYQERKQRKQSFYDEVKSAERVLIDEIPMPDIPGLPGLIPADIPLPQPKSILKRVGALPLKHLTVDDLEGRNPPGPPPGPPPVLSDSEDENEEPVKEKTRSIRFVDDSAEVDNETHETSDNTIPVAKTPLQEAMLKLEQKKKQEIEPEETEEEKNEDGEEVFAEHGSIPLPSSPRRDADDTENNEQDDSSAAITSEMAMGMGQPVMYTGPGGAPVLTRIPIPSLMRPQGIQLPPGPPPGLPPAMRLNRLPHHAFGPRLQQPRMNLPPPPGTGPPPRINQQSNVFSAPPTIMKPPTSKQDGHATISAKPVIKHHIGDVTRFVPASLKVKRYPQSASHKAVVPAAHKPTSSGPRQPQTTQTKDDAYDTFLKEIEGIM